jgi:hypothetical protein
MAELLGINKIGTSQITTIIAGDFHRATATLTSASDVSVGTACVVDGDNVTPWTEGAVEAIAASDIKAGDVGIFWLSGEFVGARIKVATGSETDWAAYWPSLDGIIKNRGNNFFFYDATLASNE